MKEPKLGVRASRSWVVTELVPTSQLCACLPQRLIASLVDRVYYSWLKPQGQVTVSTGECEPALGYRRLWSHSEQTTWGRAE